MTMITVLCQRAVHINVYAYRFRTDVLHDASPLIYVQHAGKHALDEHDARDRSHGTSCIYACCNILIYLLVYEFVLV